MPKGVSIPGTAGCSAQALLIMTRSPAPWHGLASAVLQADLHRVAPGMSPTSQTAQCPLPLAQQQRLPVGTERVLHHCG